MTAETAETAGVRRSASGRVAIVTGGAMSIGQAFAVRLGAEGARVIVADIESADDTVDLVAQAGGDARAVRCDVGDPEAVKRLVAETTDQLGGVEILVHNAGIYPLTPFEGIELDEWRRVMRVNVESLFLLVKEVLPHMRQGGWGRIVAMATTAFHAGVPGFVHYIASKGAVIGFVRSLAPEIAADGVTINALAPSLVRTVGTSQGPHDEVGQFDLALNSQAIKRTQRPSDLVGALSFLCSDDSEFITGQTIAVDGGFVRL